MRKLIAGLLMLLLGGMMAQSQETPTQTPRIQTEQDTAVDGKRQADNNANKRTNEDSEYWTILDHKLKITDTLLAVFTFFLILVGIGQAIFLYRTDQGTHKAADAAKVSADATRDAVKLAEKTAERQLRAYVLVEHAGMIATADNEIWKAVVVIKNFGQTPAYGNISWISFKPAITADTYVFERPPIPVVTTPIDIAPGQEIKLFTEAGRVFTTAEIAAFRNGSAVIFVYGEISYKDAFGTERLTSFRMKYRPPTDFDVYKNGNQSN